MIFLIRSLCLVVMSFSFTLNAASLYEAVKSPWLDVNGKAVQIDLNRGHYTLIAMVYTGCAHACPMTISKIQSLEKDLEKKGLKDFKIVLASFDVKGDRPTKLKKYQAQRKLDPAKWKLLAPQDEASVRELAVVLGISYKAIGNGEFSHSNIITLLNPEGKIVGSIDNLNADSEELTKKLETEG